MNVNFCKHPSFKILRSIKKLKIIVYEWLKADKEFADNYARAKRYSKALDLSSFFKFSKKNRAKYGISFVLKQTSVAVNCIQ